MAMEFVYPFAMELHSQGFSDRNAWHLRFNETFQLFEFLENGQIYICTGMWHGQLY